MLILTRYKDQSIIIGDNIKMRVLSVKNKQISIGIDAPDDISIQRAELDNQVLNEEAEK